MGGKKGGSTTAPVEEPPAQTEQTEQPETPSAETENPVDVEVTPETDGSENSESTDIPESTGEPAVPDEGSVGEGVSVETESDDTAG